MAKYVIDIDEENVKIMQHNIEVGNPLCPIGEEEMVAIVANATPLEEVFDDIKTEINEEREFAYADFDAYNEELLGFDDTDICDRDSCDIGLGRAIQIVNKHISGKE